MRSNTNAAEVLRLLFIIPLLFCSKAHAQSIFTDSFESGLLRPLYFIAAWQDDQADANETQIMARGSEGLFTDITVNEYFPGVQNTPAVAVAADGSFVVAWEEDGDGNGLFQVWARGFHADGSERFSRITVNSVGAGQQRHPDIAMAPNGDFVVVWEDDPDNNGLYNILGRGFYANGTERFPDKSVALTGLGSELDPAIGMAENGSFVVTWADDQDYNGFFQVKARGFHANGTDRFAAFTVNTAGAGQQLQPDIAVAPNGDFVVAWADDQDANWFYQVMARGFFANGTERFSDITLNGTGTANQYRPAVGIAADGSFAAAWADQDYRIMARQFDAGGNPQYGDKVLNDNGLQIQNRPVIDLTDDGEFVVLWDQLEADGRFTLRGRRLDTQGGMGTEFSATGASSGDQVSAAVAVR